MIRDTTSLKVGMHVAFDRNAYYHHGIVTNVWVQANCYEIIHMTGDKRTFSDKHFRGIAEIRREKQEFDPKQDMFFYDYGEYSIDSILKHIHHVLDFNAIERRARLLHEAFKKYNNDVYYEIVTFNCEHFASYCATGLAFCLQLNSLTKLENRTATEILDKTMVVYCEEILAMKRPRTTQLNRLQISCSLIDEPDSAALLETRYQSLIQRTTRRLSDFHDLHEGMELIIRKGEETHHGIVTNGCLGKNRFEVVHLNCRKGETSCQKVMIEFDSQTVQFYTYDYLNCSMHIDRDTVKRRADILYKSVYVLKDTEIGADEFNCKHFSCYCVTGLAFSNDQTHTINISATKTLNRKLRDYCEKFITHPGNTQLKRLQNSCLMKDVPDSGGVLERKRYQSLEQRTTCSLSDFNELHEGMEIIIKKGEDTHHGIVTNIYPDTNKFKVVHFNCGIGETACQNELIEFDLKTIDFDTYEYFDDSLNIDRDIVKLRAEILSKHVRVFEDIICEADSFTCKHFASYCIAGFAYSDDEPHFNRPATKMLNKLLKEYFEKELIHRLVVVPPVSPVVNTSVLT